MQNEDGLDNILNNFRPSSWKFMSKEEQMKSCQKLENYLASEGGRKPYKIEENCTRLSIDGLTQLDNELITISLQDVSCFEVLKAVVHESTHADQYHLIQMRGQAQRNGNVMSDYKKALERRELSDNDILVMKWEADYYCSVTDSVLQIGNAKLYKMQLMETDSNVRAAKFMRKHRELMSDAIDSIDTGTPNGYQFVTFDEFIKLKENKLTKLNSYFKDKNYVEKWFRDRVDRLEYTDKSEYSDADLHQLKAIYSSGSMNKSGLKIPLNIINWLDNIKSENVDKVTLDELMGEGRKGVQNIIGTVWTNRIRKRKEKSAPVQSVKFSDLWENTVNDLSGMEGDEVAICFCGWSKQALSPS